MPDETRASRLTRYFTRMATIVGAVAVLVAGIWTCANIVCTMRLTAEIRLWREAGLPLTIADATPLPITSQQNAAPAYIQALEISPHRPLAKQSPYKEGPFRSISQGDAKMISNILQGDYTEADTAHAREILARPEIDRALRGCASASVFPKCAFPMDWANISDMRYPHLWRLREAVRLASAKAVVYARDGDSENAVQWLIVALRISNHIANTPSLFAQLVTITSQNATVDAFTRIADSADLSSSIYPRLDATLATMDLQTQFNIAARREASLWLSFYASLSTGGPDAKRFVKQLLDINTSGSMLKLTRTSTLLTRPLLLADQVAYMRMMRRQDAAASKPWLQAETEFQTIEKALKRLPRVYVAHMQPSMRNITFKRDVAQARITMARIILALNAYRDVHGAYPISLSDLQPGLNWSIPIDPISGTTYAYRQTNTSFTLYSVGPDGDDDNGRPLPRSITPDDDGDVVAFPIK